MDFIFIRMPREFDGRAACGRIQRLLVGGSAPAQQGTLGSPAAMLVLKSAGWLRSFLIPRMARPSRASLRPRPEGAREGSRVAPSGAAFSLVTFSWPHKRKSPAVGQPPTSSFSSSAKPTQKNFPSPLPSPARGEAERAWGGTPRNINAAEGGSSISSLLKNTVFQQTASGTRMCRHFQTRQVFENEVKQKPRFLLYVLKKSMEGLFQQTVSLP